MKFMLVFLSVLIFACQTAGALSSIQPIQSPTLAPTPLQVLDVMGDLKLRDRPEQTLPGSHVLAFMPAGASVSWLGVCDGFWAHVRYNDVIGWASNVWMTPEVCK